MFKAVLFDLDGTLLDTERAGLAIGRQVFRDLGADLSHEDFLGLIGLDEQSGKDKLQALLGERPLAPLYEAWRKTIRAQFIADGIPLKPHALEMLETLRAEGLPLAIVTSSREESAAFKLARTDLAPYFATVVTADCVARHKPDPEPYLLAAERLGQPIAACAAFEDSALGARAAHDAGAVTVQIPDLLPAPSATPWQIAPDLRAACEALGLLSPVS